MNKIWKTAILCLTTALLLCGCSTSKKAEEASTQEDKKIAKYSVGLTEEGFLEDVEVSDLVVLCDYKNIQISKKEMEPSEDEIKEQINVLLESYGVYQGQVEEGDTVNIDYVGSIDGEEFTGGSASGYNLEIGSKSFIDGFEDQLLGHEVGEEAFDIKVTFPEDYDNDDLAGKEAVFSVTINYIFPELNNDFVKENFSGDGCNTVKELKNKVKENLRISKENEYIWEYLLINSQFQPIPDSVMDPQLDLALDVLKDEYQTYMQYGDDEIMSLYGVDSMDDVRENLREDTEKTVKTYLVTEAIAKAEKLSVDDAAIDKYIGSDNIDAYYDYYGKPYVHAHILISMVSDLVMENAVLK